MPEAPPWIRMLSPALKPPRWNRLSHTVMKVSAVPPPRSCSALGQVRGGALIGHGVLGIAATGYQASTASPRAN
jgi:hypothetical protein